MWGWFESISRRRTPGFGPSPITWQDLDAWRRVTRLDPDEWEVRAICAIDDVRMRLIAEEQAEKDRAAQSKGKKA